jgi:ABC-type uncharacterized transport system permease subunit
MKWVLRLVLAVLWVMLAFGVIIFIMPGFSTSGPVSMQVTTPFWEWSNTLISLIDLIFLIATSAALFFSFKMDREQ